MASANPARPNVVLIMTDDQGPWALGCAGNTEIMTPNLDRLAAEGMRFDRFFCTSPVCSPARASVLTGRMPSQHGVHDWLRGGNVGPDAAEYLAGQPGYTEVLAAAGYDCGLSGKWHLGDSARPQKGFGHWYAHQKGGGPYHGAPVVRAGQLTTEPGYLTEAITADAVAFIDASAGSTTPFYASVHYTAPHSPWIGQHPDEYVQLYADCPFESCPDEPLHPWALPETVPGQTWERRMESLRGYFASVTALDAGVGRILDRLDQLGLRESTLVWFVSDNGFNCGHHGIWGKGNGTYPQNMYDSSVLVPAILSQPGRIASGVVESSLVSGYDVMPTLCDYTGLEVPAGSGPLPGSSLVPLLDGSGKGNRTHEHVVVCDEYGPVRMIRDSQWKYVHRHPDGPHELYDLANDPGERTNLVDDPGYQKRVRDMRGALDEWFTRYTDPRLDGVALPVTGKGQARPITAVPQSAGGGRQAFFPLEPSAERASRHG